MQIVQYGPFRIAISRPPFSNGWEITAVRALVQTSLEDYAHADELKDRLLERQRGVLVAGRQVREVDLRTGNRVVPL